MNSATDSAPAGSPYDRLFGDPADAASTWPSGDVLLLQALFRVQRRLELLHRRPDARWRGAARGLRSAAAGTVGLFAGRTTTGAWFESLAADLAQSPEREARVRERLSAWLAGASPSQTAGRSVVMTIPSLAAGGAEGQLAQLARGLARDGADIAVLTKHLETDGLRFHAKPLTDAGVSVLALSDFPLADGRSLPPLDPDLHRLTRRLIAAFERLRPHAVHAWMDEMGAAAGLAAAATGTPRIVIDLRNASPIWTETRGLGSIRAALQALGARASFVNNSDAGAADYRAWLGLPDLSIRVVRNGVDLSTLRADPVRVDAVRARFAGEGQPLIGGMMRLAPQKSPELWIDTAAALARRRPEARFVLWGEGPLRASLERRAAEAGFAGRIAFPGVTADRANAFGALDAFLLASAAEGTPNVLLEAQALGVPIAARDAGGVNEAVAPALADLVVSGGEPERIAAALEAALGRRSAVDWPQVRAFLAERFSPEIQRAVYRELYGLPD